MPKIRIDKNDNLVTGLKKVWISRDIDGAIDVWVVQPEYSTIPGIFISSGYKAAYGFNSIASGFALTPLLQWFKANIRDKKDGPIVGGLPKPGGVWEVLLY